MLRGEEGEGAILTSFRFASSLSAMAWLAFFSLSFWRSSSSLAFFSSSVNGAMASVDSEKSVWSLVFQIVSTQGCAPMHH